MTMRLTLEHQSIRSTSTLDSWIENQIFALRDRLQIEEANVRLAHRPESSPPYQVNVHLVTPGPDVFAEGRDLTLQAAFNQVLGQLKDKIVGRALRRERRQSSKRAGRRGSEARV
jgi:ribosome-associated translation inhibitor RaiA